MIERKNTGFIILFCACLSFLNGCGNKKNEKAEISVLTPISTPSCGPASITFLKKNCSKMPDWLSEATTRNESVSIDTQGQVIWHDGTWQNGAWVKGVWYDGTWQNGAWVKGVWYDGTWHRGTWIDGAWRGGAWQNGEWANGVWEKGTWENGIWNKGVWYDGTWNNGTWKNGFWYGGTWHDGTWENGIWKGVTKNSSFDPKKAL